MALLRVTIGPAPSSATANRAGASARSARTRLISNAPDGHDDFRSFGIPLDLGTETLHVDIDKPGVGRVPIAPYLLEQNLAGEDLPGLAGQGDEQIELQRRQVQRLAGPLHRVPGHVDRDITYGQCLGGWIVGPAQPGPHACDEHLRLEWLDNVVVGA